MIVNAEAISATAATKKVKLSVILPPSPGLLRLTGHCFK
jgi:hypothetical protein